MQDLALMSITSTDWDLDWDDRAKSVGPSKVIDMGSVVTSVMPEES